MWEYLARREPRLTAKTRIIGRSQDFGFPPLVYRSGIDDSLRQRMTNALLTMDQDPEGRALLDELVLDRFTAASPDLFDSVRLNPERR